MTDGKLILGGKAIDFNAPPFKSPKVNDAFSNSVLVLAQAIFDYVDGELEGGIWYNDFDALTFDEKRALFASLADAFNDTMND